MEVFLLCSLVGVSLVFAFALFKRRLPLPPSPTPQHWLFGHTDFFKKMQKHVLMGTEYRDRYGDVITVSTVLKTEIYLNSVGAALELLEKRAGVTADRPRNVMVDEIMGWAEGPGFHPHNERHKKMRRIMGSVLHPTAARSYAPEQIENTLALLRAIAASPDRYTEHTANSIGAFLLRLTYGYVVVENDPLVRLVHSAMMTFGVAITGHWIVNDVPILKYLPSWLPGFKFQKFRKYGRDLRTQYVNEPFEAVFEQLCRNQLSRSSYTSQLPEAKGGVGATEEDIDLIKVTAAAMYSAGLSTTLDLIKNFFFLIAIHPDMSRRAQAEIDTVVGRDRLPDFGDRASLPYAEALVMETMRMSASAPIGLPHCAVEDVEFRGYHIPKGATIYADIWAILRDPAHYSHPHTFNPSRFLKSTPDPDPRKYLFGFGRRVCPGLHVANNSAWIMCTGFLAVFDIQAGEGLQTRLKEVGGRDGLGLVTLMEPVGAAPLPFDCRITVRDGLAASLLDMVTWVYGVCLGVVVAAWITRRLAVQRQTRLPPGPPGHRLWGNVSDMNTPHRPVKAATEWKEAYGNIVCLKTISNTTIIINDEPLVMEILEKRALETSDRPSNVFVREMMGWDTSTVLHRHNARHRQLRKTMALVLQQSQVRTYSALHSSNLILFLRALTKTPEEYMHHIDDSASRFIMKLAYGHDIVENDPLVAAVRAGQIYMEDGLATHRWVNSLPFLRFYPSWAPGGEFQKVAREGLQRRLEYANVPFDTVMDMFRKGDTIKPSFTSRLLEQKGGAGASEEDIDLIKWSAASLFGGGTATTVSILATLIFLLTLHPEVTQKAQEEIDRVVGRDRLPTVRDRGSLPYVEAVLQEAMRYYPVVPLCIPHSTDTDIEFCGYLIPKGCSIEPNLWAILHNSETYPDPHIFLPERYLKAQPDPDPRKYIFGFGRRVCPGIHIAYDSTFINCAGLLSVFEFIASPGLLASVEALGGRESPNMWKMFNSSKIVRPKPFKCAIRPRNNWARLLLEDSIVE